MMTTTTETVNPEATTEELITLARTLLDQNSPGLYPGIITCLIGIVTRQNKTIEYLSKVAENKVLPMEAISKAKG